MAENDNNGAPAPTEDVAVTIAALLFECRLTVEASIAGLQSISLKSPEPVKSELAVCLRFVSQAAEAFEALAGKLVGILPMRGLQS